ncbi:hypothetical protein TPHA_0G03170 [Tetrapisispora phaffii CBS 4417]|uniref:Uncharacterized protein n=1 Tax=Tetrapisispora phaffii (strain ATCC 24235 / CBS 4417 / NBRC 1672 / NRRL Y-8282 / UCD 70-5) TaxID=1071381 RepID=G8BW79_TETPH|nr:hypothetical protein TPHA_0G03170 [Tetrapisispora phaffii CBS 4417]CCE64157.1 hypothetical protein TPHA_0G03170 [Tetrapisispora phaffii CBS 4417]
MLIKNKSNRKKKEDKYKIPYESERSEEESSNLASLAASFAYKYENSDVHVVPSNSSGDEKKNFKRKSSMNLRFNYKTGSTNNENKHGFLKHNIFRHKSLRILSNKENSFDNEHIQDASTHKRHYSLYSAGKNGKLSRQSDRMLPLSPSEPKERIVTDNKPVDFERETVDIPVYQHINETDSAYYPNINDENFINILDNISLEEHMPIIAKVVCDNSELINDTQDVLIRPDSFEGNADGEIIYNIIDPTAAYNRLDGNENIITNPDDGIDMKMAEVTDLLSQAIMEGQNTPDSVTAINQFKNRASYFSSNLSNSSITTSLQIESTKGTPRRINNKDVGSSLQDTDNISTTFRHNNNKVPQKDEVIKLSFNQLFNDKQRRLQRNSSVPISVPHKGDDNFGTSISNSDINNEKLLRKKGSLPNLKYNNNIPYDNSKLRLTNIVPPTRSSRRPATSPVSNNKIFFNILDDNNGESSFSSNCHENSYTTNVLFSDSDTVSDRIFSTGNPSSSSLNVSISSPGKNKHSDFAPPPAISEIQTGTSSNYSDKIMQNIQVPKPNPYVTKIDFTNEIHVDSHQDQYSTIAGMQQNHHSNIDEIHHSKAFGKKFKSIVSKRLSKITH